MIFRLDGKRMIENLFNRIYDKFKIHFYRNVFEKLQSGELPLTTLETLCIEIIYALDRPTVSEFAKFVGISRPNAAYKINSLARKGYLRKMQSSEDKREYYLEVTEKYLEYYNISSRYMKLVMDRIEQRFTREELETLNRIMDVTNRELMPEVSIKR